MSDKYIVRYYARSFGKSVEQLNQMMINYIPKHLGKVIKFEVVPCEEITKLKKALEMAEKVINLACHIRTHDEADIVEEYAREAQKQIKEVMEGK
jgi:tellurite resistance protein